MSDLTNPSVYRVALKGIVTQQAARRARVLAWPDLAARLTKPPFTYKQPEQWSGFIPPAIVEHHGMPASNPSPHRKALIALLRDVVSAEERDGVASTPDDMIPAAVDPYSLDPSKPGSIVRPQLKALHILFSQAGITDRYLKLEFCSETIGRRIESTKELSRFEAPKISTALTRILDPEDETTTTEGSTP